MRKGRSQKIYDVERARIARWVRESDVGVMFYAPGENPVWVLPAEAEHIERTLVQALDRFVDDLERLPKRVLMAAGCGGLALMAVHAAMPAFDGPIWLLLAPLSFAYALWEGLLDPRYRLGRQRWCKAEAARFRHRRRIADDVAAHHRRHNLFRIFSNALIVAGAARVLWMVFRANDMIATYDPVGLVLIALGVFASWPAAKVDATHRRRRWLD